MVQHPLEYQDESARQELPSRSSSPDWDSPPASGNLLDRPVPPHETVIAVAFLYVTEPVAVFLANCRLHPYILFPPAEGSFQSPGCFASATE